MKEVIIYSFSALGILAVAFVTIIFVVDKIHSFRWDRNNKRNLKIETMDYLEECTGHCKICENYGKCALQPKNKYARLWYNLDSKEIEVYNCPHFTGVYYDEYEEIHVKCVNGKKIRYTYFDKKKNEWV